MLFRLLQTLKINKKSIYSSYVNFCLCIAAVILYYTEF